MTHFGRTRLVEADSKPTLPSFGSADLKTVGYGGWSVLAAASAPMIYFEVPVKLVTRRREPLALLVWAWTLNKET